MEKLTGIQNLNCFLGTIATIYRKPTQYNKSVGPDRPELKKKLMANTTLQRIQNNGIPIALCLTKRDK